MMQYCDFLQHFYDADRQVKSTLIAMNSQSDIARFFFELPFCGEIPEKYIFEGTTYKKWFTGPNKPRKGAWDAIEKNFDDACLNKCISILTSKIKKETISLLAESFEITCSSPNTINKQNLAEAIIRQFRAIVSGHGDATDIVAQTYYSKEKPAVFGEYIRKAVDAYKRMTILGGKECLLDECYVCNNIGTRPGVFVRNKNGLIYDATLEKLKSFDRRAETKNTLLIANGGMGKSLMLQHLFVDAAEKYPETGLLPVFVELREFSFNHDELFDIIVNTVQNMDDTFTTENAHQMLTAGRCQLLLDGIDEIDPQDIKEFQRKLSNFQRRYPDNQIVMTSRDCDAYSGIKGFVRLYLLPFDNSQSEELVNRLLAGENDDAKAVVNECIDGNFIKKDGAFVSNPMMLTFVVAHCNNLRDLRSKRYLFYKEAYEAIVLDHDKDKTAYERIFRSVSDSEEFTEVFQEFCAVTYRQGIFQFDSDTFKIYFDSLESKQNVENPGKLKMQNFLHDVCATACMMYEEETDILYIDPGFQEYLFARYYASASSEKMRELGETLINLSADTFGRWTAFRMLYEYSADKTEVCLFLPFLERIFKGKDDNEAFILFIKNGYKEIRYTVLDQQLIETHINEAGMMNQMVAGELNEPKTVLLSVILRILRQFNYVQIITYSEQARYFELEQKVLLGEYADVPHDEKKGKKLLLRRYLQTEFSTDTFEETHDVSRCIRDNDDELICFGKEYLISTDQLGTETEKYQPLIAEFESSSAALFQLFEVVKAYYLKIRDKQRVNNYR